MSMSVAIPISISLLIPISICVSKPIPTPIWSGVNIPGGVEEEPGWGT